MVLLELRQYFQCKSQPRQQNTGFYAFIIIKFKKLQITLHSEFLYKIKSKQNADVKTDNDVEILSKSSLIQYKTAHLKKYSFYKKYFVFKKYFNKKYILKKKLNKKAFLMKNFNEVLKKSLISMKHYFYQTEFQ